MNTLDYIVNKYGVDLNVVSPIEIPNVGRLDIIRWLRELDFKTGVEVGVAEGEYSKLICEYNPQMKIYGVDPFAPYKGYTDYSGEDIFDTLFAEAQRRLESFRKRGIYEIIKEFSMDAVNRFEDNSLDFVYIDANHRDPFITQDITKWHKKVRVGGIIAGHDFVRLRRGGYDVIHAVSSYTSKNNIKPWFLLGLNKKIPRMIRDRYRSWMWVKNK